ncbi:hypothetical protein JAAARDRAFT_190199 [Jaapia argillacea MUCL 33604]|uniref:Uncharacterized protein n=1 Tax=Jaapia argillacea MUCL 33604 TaxID=933084 RepID=A0A067Q315_9AGAM|nr:hypothetical protein JAAARDRAFT_190199 [Jaapia argillacea MUCL 33604]
MRVRERPYPSFTIVVRQAQHNPPEVIDRLSHTHPYTRFSSLRPNDPLMVTVDYRYDDPMFFSKSIPDITPETEDREDAVNLQAALDNHVVEDGTGSPPSLRRSRKRFSTLVIDLALTIKRKCQGVLTGSKET